MDKLVDQEDLDMFKPVLSKSCEAGFEELDQALLLREPILFCHFAEGI